MNTIELTLVHYSTPEPSNALNTALYANEISAKPSTNFILLKGPKQARHQAHTAILANLSTLSSYYTGFAIGLVKCYGPSVTSVSVTKAGRAGTDRRDGRGRTMGRGLSESRGSGSVREYASTSVRDGPTYQRTNVPNSIS